MEKGWAQEAIINIISLVGRLTGRFKAVGLDQRQEGTAVGRQAGSTTHSTSRRGRQACPFGSVFFFCVGGETNESVAGL